MYIIIMLVAVITGQATYYNEGVFDRVWSETRQKTMAPCEDCVGYVAMECKHLGKKVWVSNYQEWVGPLHVIDCGHFHTPGRIVELDKWLADRWNMRGPITVQVSFKEITDENRCATFMREMRQTHLRWNRGFC